uniref:Uncharacterized protein n=1 Tax=Rhizophora mucronata TaxID=61149 RepID=A0A2P2PJ92_RHIMU
MEVYSFGHDSSYLKGKNTNGFSFLGGGVVVWPFEVLFLVRRRLKKKCVLEIATHLVTHPEYPSLSHHCCSLLPPRSPSRSELSSSYILQIQNFKESSNIQ